MLSENCLQSQSAIVKLANIKNVWESNRVGQGALTEGSNFLFSKKCFKEDNHPKTNELFWY